MCYAHLRWTNALYGLRLFFDTTLTLAITRRHAWTTLKGQRVLISKTTPESSAFSALSCCNLSDMVQTITCSNPKPITFLLPDILTAWPYTQLLHPDYSTVNVESANWVNAYNLFSEKAQRSFNKSRFGQWYHDQSLYLEIHQLTSGLLGCRVFPLTTRGIRLVWFYIKISNGSKLSVVRVVILWMYILSSTSILMSLSPKLPPGFVA